MDGGDYWRMGRAGGWRLPLAFFREVHWYDIRHRTSTADRVAVEDFDVAPDRRRDSVIYMASWTSVIEKVYSEMRRQTGDAFSDLTVIDVGCGKGKFLCVWSDALRRDGIQQQVVGVDFSPTFVSVSRDNLRRRGHPGVRLVCTDVGELDISTVAKGQVMLYLYNPFSEQTLAALLQQCPPRTWIAYCHPVHDATVRAAGFELVREWSGWHPNQSMRLYVRPT